MGGQRRVGLTRAREAVGYTQEQFAEVAGVSRETVVRWEGGTNAPSVYIRPKLARLLGRSLREFADLIDSSAMGDQLAAHAISSDIDVACDWLDVHAGWRLGTARHRLISKLRGAEVGNARDRDAERGGVGRSDLVELLGRYYDDTSRWCRAVCDGVEIPLALTARPEWLDLGCTLSHETDAFTLVGQGRDAVAQLAPAAANHAVRRLVEAVALNVAIVNSPLYRLEDVGVSRDGVAGKVSTVPFVQYALTSDLLETEAVDQLVGGSERLNLPLRDQYLPTEASVFDLDGRVCCGGVLALCAIARPADRSRGPADFVLLTQERGRRVLNGVGRLSVIPRGFHQPMTDFRADASIAATLRRELEEELFRRDDVDNTLSEGRIADPMHPNRLSEPMRWLMAEPGRLRLECTGFGFNLVNGNFEFACLIVIDDPEFWTHYGDRIEANWESTGLRQYSTLDPGGIRDLIVDEAWSSEGLFALVQGLRRLSLTGDDRVDLPEIALGVVG